MSISRRTFNRTLGVSAATGLIGTLSGCNRGAQTAQAVEEPSLNGFDMDGATIPTDEILRGGPGRDGIPALHAPSFIAPPEVDYLRDDDFVMSVSRNGETRAYPLRILVWHEIANDVVGGTPVAVTYCPLCGTGMVFDRIVKGQTLTFGVSGLLYQSDVLMYDHQTESLWSQLKTRAVTGEMAGTALTWLPSDLMTWEAWKRKYPGGTVLSSETGFGRRYKQEAYAAYKESPDTMFPVPNTRTELRKKDWVFGLLVDSEAKAYPLFELEKLGDSALRDTLGNQEFEITYEGEARWARAIDVVTGESLAMVRSYWFAWQAFYPATAIYQTP